MSIKKFLFPLLLVCSVLAVIYRLFAKPASAKPVTNSGSYDAVVSYEAIDAYIEQQMRRLKMPGVSFAIVEGDKIAHLLLSTHDYFGKKSRDFGLRLRLFG